MGYGTPWVGTYTIGSSKPYIQVANIDLSTYTTWTSIPNCLAYPPTLTIAKVFETNRASGTYNTYSYTT